MRTTVSVSRPLGLLVAFTLVLGGCQACVADSSQPEESPAAQRPPSGTGIAIRPRLMSPAAHLILRDAGAGDE